MPCQGLPRKTEQFRFNPTHSCALGRRCDRVSTVHHLALGKSSGISKLVTNPSRLCQARLQTTTSIPAPHPIITMTNYTHTSTVINSSALLRTASCVWDISTTSTLAKNTLLTDSQETIMSSSWNLTKDVLLFSNMPNSISSCENILSDTANYKKYDQRNSVFTTEAKNVINNPHGT